MAYEKQATVDTPALIIYLIDCSASMSEPMEGDRTRLQVVWEALDTILRQMLMRCTRGMSIFSRYRIAMLAYSDHVYDILDGVRSIEQLAAAGMPALTTLRTTRTAKAFTQAEKLLRSEWKNLRGGPAPLVCHLTDGEYTGDDPEPIVNRIKAMTLPDGNALVENIFMSDEVLPEPIEDTRRWPGVFSSSRLAGDYARKLRNMSSELPESYRQNLTIAGYRLEPGALMMLPGNNPELLALGYQMSAATRM